MIETAELQLQRRTPGHRVLSLDALRGLAAFVVVWHHFRLCFVVGEPRWWLRPFFAGRSAVVLFFVLSGYVLALPYWRGAQPTYGIYLLRRFTRIYIPYAAAAVLALLAASQLLYSKLPLSPWFYRTWQTALTPQVIAEQFFTIPGTGEVNTAFWSLRYEMELSIIFPLVCWSISRLKGMASFVGALALEAIATAIFKNKPPSPFLMELAQSFLWGSCFIYGALLSYKSEKIGEWYGITPRWAKVAVLIGTTLVYLSTKSSVQPFAACVVLVFAERSRASRWLNMPIPEYLGRISYSMYLMHGTVLYATLILLYGKLPFVVLVGTYCALTLLLSHLFCVGVEEPSMRLGKRWAKRNLISGPLAHPRSNS